MTIFFEHEIKPFAWTERHLRALERIRQGVGADVLRPTVARGERALQATQFVGVLRLGGHTIQVLPKIYREHSASDDRACEREATHNLLHLLSYAGHLRIHERHVASLMRRTSDWFEILTGLFAMSLDEEWQRGPIRNYQVVEADLPLLKGRWRLNEQLRQGERKHIFAVAYDEFTVDNPINQLFRFVVERLWLLTRDAENRRLLGTLRQRMDAVTLPPSVRSSDASPSILNRLSRRFEPALNLARMFLDGGALQLTEGDNDSFAFIFDMNRLFEAFVAAFLIRHKESILPASLEGADILVQAKGAAYFLARAEDKPVFQLAPDILLRTRDSFPLILDTKYKQLQAHMRTQGVDQADFYQMHAYAHRYNCPRVLLLYPQTAGITSLQPTRFNLEGHPEMQIVATTVDVRCDFGTTTGRQGLIDQLRSCLALGA